MGLRTQVRLLLLLSLSLLLSPRAAHAQTADDFFHGGAMFYLSNNVPKALEVVTNGLSRFPEDLKLKKLEELLKQKQQQNQQQQQQQQNEEKKDEKKQDDKKQDQKKDEPKQDQSSQKPEESKSDEKKPADPKEMEAHAMTPEEAKRLLDAQKGDEQVLQFRPPQDQKNRAKALKDW